jgi:hypothetical protein
MKAWTRCVVSATGFLGLALGAALAISSGCGSSGSNCTLGSEKCACFSNGSCNSGLTCASNICVASGGGGGGGLSGATCESSGVTCAATGGTIEACCNSTACEYEVGNSSFPCAGTDCSTEAGVVVNYCNGTGGGGGGTTTGCSGGTGFSCPAGSSTCVCEDSGIACGSTGSNLQACCTSTACEYVVGSTYYPCGGTSCSNEAQVVINCCGL